jgi:hypothetical protein
MADTVNASIIEHFQTLVVSLDSVDERATKCG